jgi:hypothetical protein
VRWVPSCLGFPFACLICYVLQVGGPCPWLAALIPANTQFHFTKCSRCPVILGSLPPLSSGLRGAIHKSSRCAETIACHYRLGQHIQMCRKAAPQRRSLETIACHYRLWQHIQMRRKAAPQRGSLETIACHHRHMTIYKDWHLHRSMVRSPSSLAEA